MKHAHVKKELERASHLPARGVRIASLVLLIVFILPTFVLERTLGDGPTLETDKASYTVGETVSFSGLGYYPVGSTYVINVSYGGSVVASVGFASDESEGIPTDASWAIPFGAENGTYGADIFNVTDPLNVDTYRMLLASTTFEVLNATEALKGLEGNLTDLKELVISNVDIMGINNSLLASLNNSMRKLDSAVAFLEGGKNKTAANQLRASRNMLTAFIHKVLAQSDKKIDPESALALIGKANASIVYIDSMIVTVELPLGKKLALNVQRTLAKQERHLNGFILKRGLADAGSDEELIDVAGSTDAGIRDALAKAKGRKEELEDLMAQGQTDIQTLTMELLKENEEVDNVKDLAQLLQQELTSLSSARPDLGEHLGRYIKSARQALGESDDAGKGIGNLISKAQGRGKDKGSGRDNGGRGKAKGKGK